MHPSFDWLAWIEKRLPPAEHQRAEAHLAACPACRAELAALTDLTHELHHLRPALTFPLRHPTWGAVWAKAQCPPRVYPVQQLAAVFSLVVVMGLFAHPWQPRPFSQSPTVGLAQPQSVAQTYETPRPPGSLIIEASATQPAVTQPPRLSPQATPVPGPRS